MVRLPLSPATVKTLFFPFPNLKKTGIEIPARTDFIFFFFKVSNRLPNTDKEGQSRAAEEEDYFEDGDEKLCFFFPLLPPLAAIV